MEMATCSIELAPCNMEMVTCSIELSPCNIEMLPYGIGARGLSPGQLLGAAQQAKITEKTPKKAQEKRLQTKNLQLNQITHRNLCK